MSLNLKATVLAEWRITQDTENLSTPKFNEYCTKKEVIRDLLKILTQHGITSFAQLPGVSQWYASRTWWTSGMYKETEEVFGASLF